MALEINLVPDIKDEMIKTLKLRNFIFFICIVVAIASVTVTAIFGSIMGGQQIAINSKQTTIDTLSKKLTAFTDLSDYLTIKNQLGSFSTITDNKKVLSRTFNVLSALLPHGEDTITVSELSINLADDDPTFTFDAQANANTPPFIDYNVLDSFKKSMQYMRYDYGRYVDKDDNEIPAYCIIEFNNDGSVLADADRGFFGLWTIYGEGCNPFATDEDEDEEGSSSSNRGGPSLNSGNSYEDYFNNFNGHEDTSSVLSANKYTQKIAEAGYQLEPLSNYDLYASDYNLDRYEGGEVVRIWRTPQFDEWYKPQEVAGQPYMDLDGTIKNVAHFQSSCISYNGTEPADSNSKPKWTEVNETCTLVPEGTNGIRITESSNGRTSSSDLVLRFSAIITLTPEVYKFTNYHMLALSPSGHHNVTDSYVQIQSMFGERASDCEEGDAACGSNSGSGSNSSSGSNNNYGNDYEDGYGNDYEDDLYEDTGKDENTSKDEKTQDAKNTTGGER